MKLVLITFSELIFQIEQPISKYGNEHHLSDDIHITKYIVNPIPCCNCIIRYTNHCHCMIFLNFSTLSDTVQVVIPTVDYISNLRAHIIIHSGEPFSCTTCGYFILYKYKVKLHIPSYHDEKPYYRVDWVKFRHNLSYCIILHICETPFLCRICDKSIRIHKSMHTCDQSISNTVSETHTGNKPLYYAICDLTMTQSDIKFHLCTICITVKYIYPTSHMRIHTGDEASTCTYCDNILLYFTSYLQMPMKMHTGEKPLACTRCDTYNYMIIYPISQMRLHTREKPYSGSYCDKTLPNFCVINTILMPSCF